MIEVRASAPLQQVQFLLFQLGRHGSATGLAVRTQNLNNNGAGQRHHCLCGRGQSTHCRQTNKERGGVSR